jgi:hypothetical protein
MFEKGNALARAMTVNVPTDMLTADKKEATRSPVEPLSSNSLPHNLHRMI